MTQRFSVYRRLIAYLRPHPWHVLAAYGGMLFATLLNLFIPQIIKQAIDQGLDEGDASKLFWAAGLIQNIEASDLTLYAQYRHFEGEFTNGGTTTDLDDFDMVITGAKLNF
jgi:ABC-type multidrug transport system fused ATPase/permease subunit